MRVRTIVMGTSMHGGLLTNTPCLVDFRTQVCRPRPVHDAEGHTSNGHLGCWNNLGKCGACALLVTFTTDLAVAQFHMFTGKMPFDHAPHILMAAGAEPALFIMAVKSGLRPEFPSDFGHDDLQTLIKSCWNEDAAARPTAAALFKRLREIAA